MKKLLKIILWFAGISLMLFLVLMITLTTFINPNDYKQDIEKYVANNFAATLQLKGDIAWTFFPKIGFSSENIILNTQYDLKNKPLFSVQEMRVSLALLPLFSRRFEVDELIVNRPNIALYQQQDKSNWEVFNKKNNVPIANNKTIIIKKKSSTQSDNLTLKSLNIKKIIITDANFIFSNSITKTNVDHLNIILKNITMNDWFSAKINAKNISYGKEINLAFDLQTQIKLQPSINLKNFILNSKINTASLKNIAKNQTINAKLSLAKLAVFPKNSKDIDINKVQLQISQIKNKDILFKTAKVNYNTAKNGSFFIKKGTLLVDNILIDVNAQGKNLTTGLDYVATLHSNKFDLKSILNEFDINIPTKKESALRKVQITKLNIAGTAKKIIGTLNLQLDKTKIYLNSKYIIANNATKMTVNLDKIIIDNYLPNDTKNKTANKNQRQEKHTLFYNSVTPLFDTKIIKTMRRQNIDTNFDIKELIFKKEKFSKIRLNGQLNNGGLKIQSSLFGLGGKVNLSTKIQIKKIPTYHIKTNFTKIKLEKLIKILVQKDFLQGNGFVAFNIQTKGNNIKTILANTQGKASLSIKQGIIKGFDLSHTVCNAVNTLNKSKLLTDPKIKITPIKKFNSSFVINKGIMKNQDLLIDITDFKLSGAGSVDLKKIYINYRTTLHIIGNKLKNYCYANKTIRDLNFQIPCKGKVLEDDILGLCHFDYQSLGQQLLNKEVKKAENKLKKSAKKAVAEYKNKQKKLFKEKEKEIKEKAKNLIKNLF